MTHDASGWEGRINELERALAQAQGEIERLKAEMICTDAAIEGLQKKLAATSQDILRAQVEQIKARAMSTPNLTCDHATPSDYVMLCHACTDLLVSQAEKYKALTEPGGQP